MIKPVVWRILLLSLLAHFLGHSLRTQWNWLALTNDSAGYVSRWSPGGFRAPVYPWFIAMTQAGRDFDHTIGDLRVHYVYKDNPQIPLLRTVRAQKVLLATAYLLLAAACCWRFAPLPAAAVMAYAWGNGWVGRWKHYVLTESLAETGLLLMMALVVAGLRRTAAWQVWAGAVLSAVLYQTRPSSAFVGVLFAWILWRYFREERGRRRWAIPAASVAVAGLLALAPNLVGYARNGSLLYTSQASSLKLGLALYMAGEADAQRLDSENDREFLRRALAMRDDWRARDVRNAQAPYWVQVDWIVWRAMEPLGQQFFGPDRARRYTQVAQRLLPAHRAERFRIFTFQTGECFRRALTWPPPWVGVSLLLGLALAGYARRAAAAVGLLFWGTRFLAFLLFSYWSVPAYRFVRTTEMLTVLGAFAIAAAAASRLREDRRRRGQGDGPLPREQDMARSPL